MATADDLAKGSARPVLAIGATLGEGPIWWDNAVWFVDIKAHRVHRFDPASGATASWQAPDQVGWVVPRAGGGMLAGVRRGIHAFDPDADTFAPVADPEPDRPGNRLNDATVDPSGRLWFGTMDDGESEATGRLYRAADGRIADSGLPPVPITNGPAISPDGATLYHTDTLARTIWAVPVVADGSLGTPRRHIEVEDGVGNPDGSTIDAEGCLWVGMWGGWGVRRYDPDGALIGTARLPVANVTKIAFGGPDLRTAYATTACKSLDAAALAAQPLAGNLFAFDAGVAGLAAVPARI